MVRDELFQERVVRVEKPSAHFTLLRAPNGSFLRAADTHTLATFDYVDDKAIWKHVEGTNRYRHVVTGRHIEAESADAGDGRYLRHQGVLLAIDSSEANEGAVFSVGHGPAHLPSESLEPFKANSP